MDINHYFQLFCIVLAIASLGLLGLSEEKSVRYDGWFFALFSTFLAVFVAFRPLGIGVDDLWGYSRIQNSLTCPTTECGRIIQGTRDTAWYSLVGLLKSFYPSPQVALWLAGLGLGLKLWVVYRLCRYRCLALLFYVACFYIIHDVTALRVSLAISIYLLGFYLLVNQRLWRGGGVLVTSGFFHQQAFLAPLLVTGRWLRWSPFRVAWGLLLPLVLLTMALYPNDILFKWLVAQPWGHSLANLLFGVFYVHRKLHGQYDQVRLWPVVVPPTLLLMTWLLPDLQSVRRELFRYTATSLVMAAWLLWAYAVIPEVQLRFWHFFLVPVVFVIGNARLTRWKLLAILGLSAVYVVKYTSMHDLLLDQRHLLAHQSTGGQILVKTPGIPCGEDCGLRITQGTKVSLVAKPDKGYRFDRWLSGCDGVTPACQLVLDVDQSVRAAFVPVRPLSLTVKGQGGVAIRSAGKDIPCKLPCSPELDQGAVAELRAQPAKGFRWFGWAGRCAGQEAVCHLTMDGAYSVEAQFVPVFAVVVARPEGGRVLWDDASAASCPDACQKTLDAGSVVRLRAEPEAGYRFERWSSGCQGEQPVCSFTLGGATNVSASFAKTIATDVTPSDAGQVLQP